jgi:hypothetical protein
VVGAGRVDDVVVDVVVVVEVDGVGSVARTVDRELSGDGGAGSSGC